MPLDLDVRELESDRPNYSERHGTLYAQVANVLRQRINSGQWSAGQQIPTLYALEKEFRVARVTLRQALSLLESEGLIWRRRGLGTFVSERGGPEWIRVATSRDELVQLLEGAWSRLIDVSPDETGIPYLDEGDGEPVAAYRHMRRLHGRGERAYAVVDMYLDKAVYAQAPARFDTEMIIPVLDKLPGVEIDDIRQTLTIGTADRHIAEPLEIPIGAPIGILRRMVRDASGRVIYVGSVNYRGDVVKLQISLAGTKGEK